MMKTKVKIDGEFGEKMEDKDLLVLIGNDTGTATCLEQYILDGTKKDIDHMSKDGVHFYHLIGEIAFYAQNFECCLRNFFAMNQIDESNIWRIGALLNEFEKKGLFSVREVEILRRIVEFRNWVVHELFQQEQEGALTVDYRNAKLAVTKHMLLEAIDFVNDKIDKMQGKSGVANIINNSYNR